MCGRSLHHLALLIVSSQEGQDIADCRFKMAWLLQGESCPSLKLPGVPGDASCRSSKAPPNESWRKLGQSEGRNAGDVLLAHAGNYVPELHTLAREKEPTLNIVLPARLFETSLSPQTQFFLNPPSGATYMHRFFL